MTTLWSDVLAFLAVPMSAVLKWCGLLCHAGPFVGACMLAHCHMGPGLGFQSLPLQAEHFMLVYSAAFQDPRV